MASSQSTFTLQNLYDDLVAKGDLEPGWDEAGYTIRPIINIANRTFMEMCGGEGRFPWKWNTFKLPLFVWNSWQQDYALIGNAGQMPANGGPSVTNLEWLMIGIAIDINNPSMPKPWTWVQTERQQSPSTGSYISNSAFVQPLCGANWDFNANMYFGQWGAAQTGNSTWGNNPQPNQTILNPLQNGQSMPSNPITQVQDANGNLLVLTQYGKTGNTAPAAAINAAPGTEVADGTCVWTVADPYGAGIRIAPVPSQTGTVWQINLAGQLKPPKFSASASLASQTLFPLPDSFYPRFLDGATAECYRYSPNLKKRAQWEPAMRVWRASLMAAALGNDREREQFRIRPARTIIGAGGSSQGGNLGPFWPFGYPVS